MVTEVFTQLGRLFAAASVTPTGIIHVGAHHGQEVPFYKKFVSDEQITLFEPMPQSAQILRNKYPKTNVIQKAVGYTNSVTTFYEVDGLAGERSSAMKPINMQPTKSYDVEVVNLDSLPFLIGNVLVLDCQGAEHNTIFGGINYILGNIDAMIVELADVRYEGQSSAGVIKASVEGLGFRATETFVHPGNKAVSDVFFAR